MTTRTQLDQKGSLNAIWHEYLSVKVLLSNIKNAAKPNTSVGHALLNARYYDSQRGQFLSEDPVFLAEPTKQDLSNPQSLNSYSYANGNPIVLSDPAGRSGQTAADGAASPFVYAYNNPIQTVAIAGVSIGIAAISPFAAAGVAIVGVGVGSYAVGTAIANAYYAPDGDTRDYYLGQAATFGALTYSSFLATDNLGAPLKAKFGSSGGPGAGKAFPEYVKAQAREQADNTCVFCGTKTTRTPGPTQSNIDHSTSVKNGGNNTLANAQNLCRDCNLQKSSANTVQYLASQFMKSVKSLLGR